MVTARELMQCLQTEDRTLHQPGPSITARFFTLKRPDNPESDHEYNVLFDAAFSAQRAGDNRKAIALYTKAIELNSLIADSYVNRGASFFARGDDDSAERDFTRALELDPTYAHAYGARSYVFIRGGDANSALRDLNRALELTPDFAAAYAVRGALYVERGELDKAIQDLDTALELDPQNADAYIDRGVAYERKGDTVRAIRDYDQCLLMRPNRMAYANRGFARLRKSQWARAKSDLLSSRNMGMNIVSAFRAACGDVAAFEKAQGLKLPPDIADLVSIEQDAPDLSSLFEAIDKIRGSVPASEWDKLPTDGAANYKHYLYGHPKATES